MAGVASISNKDAAFGRIAAAGLNMMWPECGPYHQTTIDFWRRVDTTLSEATSNIIYCDNDTFHAIRDYAHQAAHRLVSNDCQNVYGENPMDGSDM